MSDNKKIFLKFVTSCTKDEAVARMLGWMQGPVYYTELEMTEDNNVPMEYLSYLSSLPNSLEEQLTYLVGEAKEDLDDAKSSGAGPNIIKQKKATLDQCFEWIDKAERYMAAIDDELSRDESSMLRFDQKATSEYGKPRITIESLDKWSRERYHISILQNSSPLNDNILVPDKKKKRTSVLWLQQEKAILAEIQRLDHDPKDLPDYSSGKPGIKNQIKKEILNRGLFKSSRVYVKAWKRLRDKKTIQYKSETASR